LLFAGVVLAASVAFAVRHGDLLLTDFANNRVLEVDPSNWRSQDVRAGRWYDESAHAAARDRRGSGRRCLRRHRGQRGDPNAVAIDASGQASFIGGDTDCYAG